MAVFRVRPTGYKYPVGLSLNLGDVTGSELINVATNITGGTQTIDGTNTVHSFTASGFFDNQTDLDVSVEYLVVAGGGGGGGAGNSGAAGGGAGGLLYASGYTVDASANVRVIVGAGGAGGPASAGTGRGSRGVNSSIQIISSPGSNVECFGGGGGACQNFPSADGQPGGSGGGSGVEPTGVVGTGTPGQGNSGGGPAFGDGGGSLTAGNPGSNPVQGGLGTTYSISGSPLPYAAGGTGGAGNHSTSSANNIGGRGESPVNAGNNGTGFVNRGAGGGGAWNSGSNPGKAGGSGIIILRYETTQYANTFGYLIN